MPLPLFGILASGPLRPYLIVTPPLEGESRKPSRTLNLSKGVKMSKDQRAGEG